MTATESHEYAARLQERRHRVEKLDRADRRLADLRLVLVLLLAPLAWAVFGSPSWSGVWFVPPVLGFVTLVLVHDQVIRRRARARLQVRFYERGLERLNGTWMGKGKRGERFLNPAHPYAADLDLFGEGSLFELLCAAHTLAGEQRLATWLLAPAAPDEVLERQAAVQELSGALAHREALYVEAGEVAPEVHPDRLTFWAEGPPRFPSAPLVFLPALGFAALAIGAAVAWGLGDGPVPLLGVVMLELLFFATIAKKVSAALEGVEAPGRELRVLSGLLSLFEAHPVETPRLMKLRAALLGEVPASRAIVLLARLIELSDARKNQLFAIPAFMLMWGPIFALLIEGWRRRHGPRVRDWLSAVAELEALASLAALRYERPAYAFPTLASGPAHYEAVGLAHPLLGPEAVANDVALSAPLRLYLVSGSNMSGKSTLLRSIGTSVVLGLAGGPVRATSLHLTPLQLGATLRVQDSLMAGASRFYAEIQRLQLLLELAAKPVPLLFLLDELLHGTNSHDRQQGAAALLSALLERGAVGLVTTHDLALAQIAAGFAERARNVHFADHLEAGRLAFDFKMRPGVVEKSNAIALMRAVGLPL